MFLLIGVATTGLLVSSLMSFVVLQQLKVNGPIYREIVQGKDLAADILPPPEYIIESYLTLKMLQDEADPIRKQALIKALEQLKTEYEARHEYWERTLPERTSKRFWRRIPTLRRPSSTRPPLASSFPGSCRAIRNPRTGSWMVR
jgi:hypothetical protein